jgi:hypothetical protein
MGTDVPNQIAPKWLRRAVLVITALESMVMFVIIAMVVSSGALNSGEALSR